MSVIPAPESCGARDQEFKFNLKCLWSWRPDRVTREPASEINTRASALAQQMRSPKVPTAQKHRHGDMSSILRTHIKAERENQLRKVVL